MLTLDYLELKDVKEIWIKQGSSIFIWNKEGIKTQLYDLVSKDELRYNLNRLYLNEELVDDGDKFYIFYVQDCAFPPFYLVRGDSFEDSYEKFCDYAAENLGLEITEEELPDYLDDSGEYNGNYTSDGKMIDSEAIMGNETKLWKIILEN